MRSNVVKRILSLSILFGIVFCPTINCFAQTIDPLSLHFKKDYQVRNFYNSSVELSKLDLSQDVLNESITNMDNNLMNTFTINKW